MNEPLWKRIKYALEFCAEAVENTRTAIASTDAELPLDSRSTGIAARLFRITDPTVIAVLKHLGVRLPDDDLSDWEPLTREIPALAVHYFYGAWRAGFVDFVSDAPDPSRPWLKGGPLSVAECRQQLEWIDELRYGLVWSLIYDDEENLAKLAEWPDTDLREDEGLDDLTKADCDYYAVMCKWLLGEAIDWDGPRTASIRAGTKRRAKLLLATLHAIARNDCADYRKAVMDHLRHYQRTEFHTRSIIRTISVDGTILWHLARRAGLSQPVLPDSLEHLVLTHATLPISKKE